MLGFFPDRNKVVGGIKVCIEGAPGAFLYGLVEGAEFAGGDLDGDDLADAHHDVPGHDAGGLGWEQPAEVMLPLDRLDGVEVLVLLVPEEDGDHNRV